MKNVFKIDMVKIILGRLLLVLFVSYMLLNTGIAVRENYQINQTIKTLKVAISDLKKEIALLHSKIAYYKSDSFKEIEARRRLGLKGVNETVVLVPENKNDDFLESQTVKGIIENNNKKLENFNFFEKASQNALGWWHWFLSAGGKSGLEF